MRRPSLACQVEGCPADLAGLRSYFQRQHICEEHARADAIPDAYGGFMRFCQQCTKLEPLAAFEGTKRSCRASLAKRHLRRSGGRRAPSASDIATRSYSSNEQEEGRAASLAHGVPGLDGGGAGMGGIQRAVAFAAAAAAAAAAGERGSPCSAVSRQPDGTTRSTTAGAPAQLAALLEAALPPLSSDEPGPGGSAGAAAVAAAAGGLTQHQMGPVPIGAVELKGSSILEPQPEPAQQSGHLSAHLPPLRPTPSHGGTGLPSLAALTGGGPALATGAPAEPPANFLAAVLGGGAPPSPPGSAPSAAATAFHAPRGSGDTIVGPNASELLPYLASVLSSRASVEQPAAAPRGGAAALRLADMAAPQHALLQELQQQQDLEQLLTALQMLQQLQGLIGGIVVGQLQQQLARVEAAALLDQQLLPLLAGIQARQAAASAAVAQHGGASGDPQLRAEARGVQQQLDHILGQLGQLVGVLQAAPPPGLTAQVLAAQQHAAQQQAQQQQHAAQQLQQQQLADATASAQQQQKQDGGAAHSAPAGQLGPAQVNGGIGAEQLHALLQRISPMLKRQE